MSLASGIMAPDMMMEPPSRGSNPMSSPATPSNTPPAKSHRSAGRWCVIGFFGLLAAGFVFRFVQNAWHWLSGHTSPDANYKVLTIWCLIYVVVCSGIAAFTYWLPAEDDEQAE